MPRRILITRHFSRPVHQTIAEGIHRATLSFPDWKVGALNTLERYQKVAEKIQIWKPDGLVMCITPIDDQVLDLLADIPTVLIDLSHDRREEISMVGVDDHKAGERAAEYLMAKGFTTLAFVADHGRIDRAMIRFREEGFTRTLERAGITPLRFLVDHTGAQPWYRNPELETWLRDLPKPVGIYCAQDGGALRILEHCEHIGIMVPTEISVLGNGNNQLMCESIRPNLSSVPSPYVEMGEHAVRLLAKMFEMEDAGEPRTVLKMKVEPGEVVERQSTSLRMISDPAIAKAVHYLQDQALHGATIDQAARVAGLNRRTMERGIREQTGKSPKKLLDQFKADYAKRLLRETDEPIYKVADTCSFTPDHFVKFFKSQTGLTPRAYRKRHRSPRTDLP
jgi:LacI family transcriptional regulator